MIDQQRLRKQIETIHSLDNELKLNTDNGVRMEFLGTTDRKSVLYNYNREV